MVEILVDTAPEQSAGFAAVYIQEEGEFVVREYLLLDDMLEEGDDTIRGHVREG